MRLLSHACLVLCLVSVPYDFASAASVQSIEVPELQGLVTGDYVRVIVTQTFVSPVYTTIFIPRTRVQVTSGAKKGLMSLRLPCIPAIDMMKISMAQGNNAYFTAELVKKSSQGLEKEKPSSNNEKRSLKIIDSKGVTPGWCEGELQ